MSNLVGSFWRTRCGSYAAITELTPAGQLKGRLYDPNGKFLFENFWFPQTLNNLATKNLDLINRKMGDAPKGWPKWTDSFSK